MLGTKYSQGHFGRKRLKVGFHNEVPDWMVRGKVGQTHVLGMRLETRSGCFD